MIRTISKSLLLLTFTVVLGCIAYPLAVWAVGQALFPFQANGSMVLRADGTAVGSLLIAQPFTKPEYFHPRPSAASYDGSASTSSSLAPSNYLLRNRVARTLGPIVKYRGGAQDGQLVGPDVEAWFQADHFQGAPHVVAQWADAHNALAQAWVKADPLNEQFVNEWAKAHPDVVTQWVHDNPATPEPAAADLAVVFFEKWSEESAGTWPALVDHAADDGTTTKAMEPTKDGEEVQGVFFDMWRQDHPDVALQDVPGDLVTASGSGLDPHITLQNAEFQLDRVAAKWASNTKRDATAIRGEIEAMLQSNAAAPFNGLAGEKLINVLQVNLELTRHYGKTS